MLADLIMLIMMFLKPLGCMPSGKKAELKSSFNYFNNANTRNTAVKNITLMTSGNSILEVMIKMSYNELNNAWSILHHTSANIPSYRVFSLI